MDDIQLVGVYSVEGCRDAHLVELVLRLPPPQVAAEAFCQSDDRLPKSSWQTAYDEHYLDETGATVTGRAFDNFKLSGPTTRIAFFLHDIDFAKPLLWQKGEIPLVSPAPMPERLAEIIAYEPVD